MEGKSKIQKLKHTQGPSFIPIHRQVPLTLGRYCAAQLASKGLARFVVFVERASFLKVEQR